MKFEMTVFVIVIGALLAVKFFLRLYDAEYQSALAARRAVNKSRQRLQAKIRVMLAQHGEGGDSE